MTVGEGRNLIKTNFKMGTYLLIRNLQKELWCGLCVTTCPEQALSLVEKPEDKQYRPPKNGMDLMLKTAEKRDTSLNPQSMTKVNAIL